MATGTGRSPPASGRFESASVILPVMNETHSVLKTVAIIERDCRADVAEYLIVVCERTRNESLLVAQEMAQTDPCRFVLFYQNLPFLGGAIREAFDLARGSHVIMMASDLETDPADVKHLIAMAKRHPTAVITASRWAEGGNFAGYAKFKLLLNYGFQKFFSMVYGTKLTDMTYGYRIFPTPLVRSIDWQELRHSFLFETVIKPLRLGVAVHEIPTKWNARVEGQSQNTFLHNFAYLKIGFKARFSPPDSLLR